MHPIVLAAAFDPGLLLIVGASIAFYVASRSAVSALSGGGVSAGRLAVGHAIPVAAVAFYAVWANRPEIGVGVVFATAVAAMSLVAGSVLIVTTEPVRGPIQRAAAFLLPTALLLMMTGFRGQFTPFHAVVMLLEGAVILGAWQDGESGEPRLPRSGERIVVSGVEGILAVALAVIGGWLAVRGIDVSGRNRPAASSGLLSTTLLGPLLVLPMIGTGSELAQRGRANTAVSALAGFSLLCACAILPSMVAVAAVRNRVHYPTVAGTTRPTIGEVIHHWMHPMSAATVPLPIPVWRVDTVLLIALGLGVLPVAFGRWTPDKRMGGVLLGGYVMYLVFSLYVRTAWLWQQ